MRATYATPPSAAEIPPGAMCPDLDIMSETIWSKQQKQEKFQNAWVKWDFDFVQKADD